MSGNANQRRRRPGSRDVEASGSRAGYSPQGSREICRDFMGGACARGTKCRFSHIQPVENQTNTGQASASVPHDACRAYWNTGTCSRGNNCKFQHRRPTDPTPAEAPKDLQSHFEAAGLGVFPGLANDQFSPGGSNETPGRTHYQLKIYMEDSFRFQTEGQVYRFLELVCNASSQNPNWKPEDGHKHFHELVKGNGILRLGDAIRFPTETSRPWSFQRGYIPILTYLSSEWVVKSTIHSNINALYGLVHNEFEVWKNTIEQHMSRLMSVRSFKDGPKALSGKQVFKVLFVTLFEYLTRFKQAMTTNPEVFDFVIKVCEWFEEWATALRSTPRFDDECSGYEDDMKDYIIDNLRRDKERALHVIGRGRPRIAEPAAGHQQPASAEGLVAILQRNCDYEGPGELRERGPRHDNDFVSIREIRIPPTNRELMSADDPYLPPNFVEAPHFLESKSVERLLDIQFRLLREELIAPIRMAVQLIVSDWQKPSSATTMLSKLIAAGGGRYAAPGSAQESVIFSVFTNVDFEPLSASNRGTSVGVVFDTPPGKARAEEPDARAAYWEQISKKRLMLGGLVALIWKDPAGVVDIYVGTISSTPRDLADAARKSKDRISLRVSFFDTIAELRIVRAFQNRRENNGSQILIEAPVFYEGIRPFLEALKKEPELLPFSHYLCHQSREELAQIQIAPPVYSLAPRFSFELKDLFPTSAGVQSLSLVTNNPDSVARAKATLIRSSRLDPSQADAVVDSLTREISLIQGPPGTGKSYTGLELIRVLIKNQVSPILLVAFTNHALDHMLNGILDAEITKNIIRLGSRSDDRIAQFSLDATEKLQSKSMLDRDINAAYRGMKTAEEEMTALMKKIALRQIPLDHIEDCILSSYPFHYDELFSNAPSWISTLVTQANENQEGWETVGSSSRDLSIIGFWAYSRDLLFLETPKVPTPEASSSQQPVASLNAFDVLSADAQGTGETSSPNLAAQHHAFVAQFMSQHGLNKIPPIPTSDRPIGNLLADPRVWSMSRNERARLYDRWYMAASESTRQTQVEEFENLRKNHSDAHRAWAELKEQARVNILRRAHIIGCTTTGAAKVISVLSAVEPKVMIVEEAGQVLESHILASLVQSIQHVVMIGDPLQLRPSINSYKLATDNRITGMIYRFDQSLMERLSSGGFPMSQLDVQRRMRPKISSLIKNTLYPKLQDHPLVLEYPKVRGMHKDVFFVSHSNKEAGGGEDSVSKHNEYEINMIYDLVLHLLRQGCYSKSGNIVILAAYLGQIPKIRKKLQDVVTTIIDDRDSELLVQYGLEDEEVEAVQRVQVSTRVLIRTLDNFQGEEGDVIILSLVRNSGTKFEGDLSSLRHVPGARSQIGFLKSTNRMNVGLSRAKHGMYIFGNAPELSRNSQMWASVLQELHGSGCVGKALPISCHRHPSYVEWIDQPGRLKIVSPDGGCLEPCLAPLRCGHRCPFKCHSDDPHHATTRCQEPCLKLCPLSHPCDRQCWECAKVLGDCRFPVRNVPLPCGHTHPKAQCYLARLPEKIKCVTTVTKQLPFCEHSARMPCHQDPAKYVCQERCGAAYSCCSKSCSASCGTCQKLNTHTTTEVQIGRIKRINHPKHPCGRILFCGHTCKDDCVKGHTCSGSCKQQCRQICSHGSCRLPCSSPCKPCVRPCGWNCAHGKCQSACGMACTRLPCDIKCPKMLKCGHPCPSVCGEPCEVQTCKKCASDNTLDSIVDLVMHISLRDLEDDTGLDSMTITLPCRHVFTVETLDGHTQLGDFYEKNQAGNWIKPIIPQSSGETRKRPVCPTCRGDISSLRYGRVCKNSNLAIMQHNIASSLSQRLSQAESKLSTARNQVNSAISEALKKCLPVASTTDLTPELRQQRLDKLEIALAREVDRPTPVETLQNLGTFHPFPEKDAKLWKGAVSALLESYRMARQIACNRDPSVQAYEASLATLYQEELNYFGVDMSRGVPSDVEQRALRLARMRIGQPPPRASLRFVVEAFWITIDILMLLGTATDQASGEVRQREGCTHNSSYWSTLAKFFFERAVEDAGVALKLAEGSESWNKAVKCQLVVLRAKYELAAYRCRTAVDTRAISDPEVREASVKMCDQGIQYLQGLQSTVPQNYLRRWSGDELVERHQWVTENFSQPSNVLLDSWKQIRRSAKSGTWYSEVTNEERLEIMRAMMQGSRRDRPLMHTGHFYQCPNGHPYVIGECGGAMQESRCPECGARIGGHDHRAAVGNRHAADFVNLAREAGAEESPWRWGPNRGRP